MQISGSKVGGGSGEDVAHVVGFVLDLVVGEAQRSEAGGSVGLVAEGVAGLGGGGAVVAPAVGLDHQAEVRPVEVDLEAVDHRFGQRRREARPGGDRPEAGLRARCRRDGRCGGRAECAAAARPARRRARRAPPASVSGSTRSRLSASLTARSSRFGGSSVARSIRVRTGVVTGMPLRSVTSRSDRHGRARASIPGAGDACSARRTLTSIRRRPASAPIPQSAAALP